MSFWIALALAALAARPVWLALLKTKSRQTVSIHAPEGHQAKQGTPTMGGLIVLAGLIPTLAFAPGIERRAELLVLAIGFALIGFVDDFVVPRMIKGKRGLGWRQKILMQLAVAGVAAFLHGGGPLALSTYVFVVLFFSNAYNFSDGLDGLAGGILLMMTLAVVALGGASVGLGLALAGATIPFLMVNAPPAKVFMGDVGSLPIGALVGAAAVTMAGERGVLPVALWSGVMIVELVPVPLQILAVKTIKRRIFPYTPVHHAFERAGWPETRVTAMFVLAQLVLSAAAISVGRFL